MSVTKLIEHVLEEVSIDGSEGTTIKQLFVYATEFYTKTLVPKVEINSLCGPPQDPWGSSASGGGGEAGLGDSATPQGQPAYWGVPNMRDEFQDYVWDILRQQEDFKVGMNGEGNGLSLDEIVADLRNQAEDSKGEANGGGKVWRVYTSEGRHWKTLTGHGPDLKRVPNAVFKCLEVIAKHREQGLIQPELTKITGQDKKSVAGRTTILKNLGLIEKVSVLAKSLNTSKLTLTKYALQRDIKRHVAQESREVVVKKRGKKFLDTKNDVANIAWTGATIDTEKLIKAIFLELKGAKNQVLMHSDLKRKLGMDKSRFHWRCFSRILRKLESLGVVRRIRVPLKILRKYRKTQGPSEIAITEQCHARCVRLIREMEREDWRKVLTTFSKREFVMEDEDDGEAEGSEDEAAKGGNNIEDEDPVVAQELGQVNVDEVVEEIVRDPPQWRKDKPLTTTIFDIVDSCGKSGISSMDLMYNTIGSFYYRPMDQILHRLTDYPQQSQPPQYMHLAIIRETGISGRQTHYRYFSYRWHQELVAEGVAVQPWGPAVKKKGSKQVSHGAITQAMEAPLSLDKYGFLAPNTSRFLKSDGSATLAESQLEGKKKERLDSLKAQFRVLRNKAGEEQLDWKNSSPRGGRPRKYEKGKEPYLAAKRRAEARRIITEGATGLVELNGTDLDGATRGRSLSNETEGDALGMEPPPKRARIEELLNPEDLEPISPPKRRGRPPGVKNGEGKKRQAAKKREKKPKVIPKKATRESKTPQKPQERQERQEPQLSPANAEPERDRQENPKSLGKRKAQAAGGKTGRAKRRKGADQAGLLEDDGVIIYDSIVVRPSTELVPDTRISTGAEPVLAGPAPGNIEQFGGQPLKKVARVVDGVQLEIEHLDVEGNDSYGSIGGMLAISRQQVVLDLLRENNGVFPSGNELRHAYSKRYQKSNPKAGVCDRRLIRGIVQSLQCRKMAYQITFDFISSRGIFITKKLLIDSRLTPDSPLVDDMVREMIAADGNLWFPPNTELHDDIQERFVQPPSWSLPKPRKSEEVEFDRVYPTSVSELKQKREARARERAATKAAKLSVIARPRGRPRTYPVDEVFNHRAGGKFTDQQREEAANRRRAELKAERELMKLNHRYRTRATNADLFDPSPIVDGLPRRVWWNEFVGRDLNKPKDADSFLQQVYDIERWEKAVGPEGLRTTAEKADGITMINLFAPPVEKGDNFVQIPVANMDNRITAPDFSAPLPAGPKKRGPKPRPKKIRKDPSKARAVDVLMGEQPAKRKRRRPGTYEKPLTRRDRAMAAIRDNQLKPSDTELLTELPPRRFQFRNQYIIPKEDEDTLLIAVIIVRTIFGGWDRKIHWDLLTKALPQHSVITLQRRWPRVRDTHKAHMKKLQSEFEDMFLEAYESGEVPTFDMDDPSSFDLLFHVNWFRENLELPEAQAVPQLPATREAFDAQYDLRVEPLKPWRNDYHNPLMTMGHRVNHFMCHSYDFPLDGGKGKNGDEDEKEVEYIKSVIKRAFEILHSCPERVVDAAFYNLSISKTISHKKRDRLRATPGPNYEFTDKFHMALKTPMDENLFAQAVAYERYLEETFAKYKAIEISPLTNDGSMACIFAMVASRRILLGRSGYVADEFGLIDGYKTRAMDKKMVDFKVHIRPGPDYHRKPNPNPDPPIPRGNMDPTNRDPIRLWISLDGTAVVGMWLKVLTAVAATITSRPGISNREVSKALFPCVSLIELDDILAWLVERGCVEQRGEGADTGNWAREGYFLAFKGLDYLPA